MHQRDLSSSLASSFTVGCLCTGMSGKQGMEGKRGSEFWNSVSIVLGLPVTVEVIILLRFSVTRTIGKLSTSSALLKVSLQQRGGQLHHPCQDYLVHPDLPTEHLTAPATRFPEKIWLCLSEPHPRACVWNEHPTGAALF